MIAARKRNWSGYLPSLERWTARPWFYPVALFLLGLVVYGYALGHLGYFWDDWEVVFLLNARNPALFAGYFAFDRPFAWPYQVMYAVFGLNPVAWHVATFTMRWGGVFLLYLSLRPVWPRYASYLKWVGALVLLYPGYLQQPISAAYNRHFTAFFLFGLSVFLMVMAVRKPAQAWWLFPVSWITAFVQVFTIEYFTGLELIRPVILWLLLARERGESGRNTLNRAALLEVPYLLILGFYFWWRLAIFPTTISVTNYAGDFKLLQDFSGSFFAGVSTVLTRLVLDLIYASFQVWLSVLGNPDAFTLKSKIAWFAFGLGILLSLIFAFLFPVHRRSEPADEDAPRSWLLFGLWAFVVSALPVWLTSKQLNARGLWDDRFTLAPMLGAVLLTVGLIIWVIRPRWQRLTLSVLLGLSIVTQVLLVNKYRLDWVEQNNYYWQLAWRAPGLAPQTAVLSLEQPSASIPGYDASFAINVLYDGRVQDHAVPYWFFTNDRFLNFSFTPGQKISYKDRNLRFSGSTSEAISIVHQGQDRCLQVLDAPYADEPFYVAHQEQLVTVSNVSRILSDARTPPSVDVFGPEPPHTWCYYFEKADLARQQQHWDEILQLERQATAAGYSPGWGPEYLPFIEAHAQRGDWARALALSRAAQESISEMEPLLCSTWDRLSKLSGADAVVVGQAQQAFSCASR
jgi:hypothetical protein